MLKEVKIFRGIVLSAPGTILGRKCWGEKQKKKPSVFRKISRACFCLIPSVRLSFRNNCLSLSQFLPSFPFPLNFSPMTHFRFQVTCYADKYLTSLWAIVWEDVGAWWTRFCCHDKNLWEEEKNQCYGNVILFLPTEKTSHVLQSMLDSPLPKFLPLLSPFSPALYSESAQSDQYRPPCAE